MNQPLKQFMRYVVAQGWSGGIGAAMLLAALALAVFQTGPQMQRLSAMEQKLAGLTAMESHQAQRQPETTPEKQLADFRASIPRQTELNSLLESLHMLASSHHLTLKNGEYRATTLASGLGRLQISVKTEGSYADLRGFLNEAALALPSLALGRCTLSRQRIADTALESTLEFQLLYASE